jgi:hypothetical protein
VLNPGMTQCDRCLFSAHHYLLVCAPHPDGPNVDPCPDFQVHPQLEGNWWWIVLVSVDGNLAIWGDRTGIAFEANEITI